MMTDFAIATWSDRHLDPPPYREDSDSRSDRIRERQEAEEARREQEFDEERDRGLED